MNEYTIVTEKVLPCIYNTLKWPKNMVSNYGRVPVQMGTDTKWADIICYVSQKARLLPWIVFEVKDAKSDLQQAVSQAESYSLILGAPFFCVTNGENYLYYLTGSAQGKSIPLQNFSLIPSGKLLCQEFESYFPPRVDDLIDLFINALKTDNNLFDDTKKHAEGINNLNLHVFQQLNTISPEELKEQFDNNLMLKTPNKKLIFEQIDKEDGFNKVKKILEYINNFDEDSINVINTLLQDKDYSLKGGGIFFITQLFAGAHPTEYMVLEDNISYALKDLGIVDVLIKSDVANGYIYINEICKKLYFSKMERKLRENGLDFGLAAVHNFLWHYYAYYRVKSKWM